MRVSSIKLRCCVSMLFLALLLAIPLFFSFNMEVKAAENSQITLEKNMPKTKDFTYGNTTYHMAQMSGETLKSFGCTKVDVAKQYLVWVNVDKQATSTNTWYTKRVYLHKQPVSNYDVSGFYNKTKTSLGDMNTSGSVNNGVKYGKVSGVNVVGHFSGYTEALFYYSSTDLQEKVSIIKDDRFTVYLSPLIDHKVNVRVQNQDYKAAWSWYTNGGGGMLLGRFQLCALYVPISLEVDSFTVVVRYRNELDVYDEYNSKALQKHYIARNETTEIKEDRTLTIKRGERKKISPDNYNGDASTKIVDVLNRCVRDIIP